TALGSSCRAPRTLPTVTDARAKQRMQGQQVPEVPPRQRLPACPPVEPFVPEPPDLPIELPQRAGVRRPAVVLVVAPEFGVERGGLVLDRVVPMVLAPLRHRLHATSKAFAHGPDVNRKPSPPAARTDVREAEEIEGRRLWRVGAS